MNFARAADSALANSCRSGELRRGMFLRRGKEPAKSEAWTSPRRTCHFLEGAGEIRRAVMEMRLKTATPSAGHQPARRLQALAGQRISA